jgi:exodeoxyribonuclease V alpha subunit
MKELSINDLEELSILNFKNKSKLRKIYGYALINSNLSIIDYMTIRDILNLSGYDDVELHVLLVLMFVSLSKGSICIKIDKESLENKINSIQIDDSESIAGKIIKKIENFPELIYTVQSQKDLFHERKNEFKPLVLQIDEKYKLLYFYKYYKSEQKLKQKLFELIKISYFEKINIQDTEKIIHEILNEKPIFFNNLPSQFNNDQIMAMLVPVFHNLSIISGGPGTGKTSIVLNIVRIFVRLGIPVEKIKITAPTGRAAQKISDSILKNLKFIKTQNEIDSSLEEISCSTIHRLLKFDPGANNFYYNDKNKMDVDVLIIDEISMVDVILLSKLLDAVNQNTRVIFLGDRNQLPSVEAGAILADLIPDESRIFYSNDFIKLISNIIQKTAKNFDVKTCGDESSLKNMVVLLHENFRSEKSIQNISDAINEKNISAIEQIPVLEIVNLNRNSVSFENCDVIKWPGSDGDKDEHKNGGVFKILEQDNSIFEIHTLLSSWINHQFIKKDLDGEKYLSLISEIAEYDLNTIDDTRALKILEKLFLFIDHAKILTPLNSGLAGTIGINSFIINTFFKKFDPHSNGKVFAGLPVMINKNDYTKSLFNGDTGIILRQKDKKYCAVFIRSGEFVSYPLEMLESYVPAFAITVHKSQGSEYNEVLFIIPGSTPDKMVSKEIIYTGITRAKDLVILYSNDEKLKNSTMIKNERESGIISDFARGVLNTPG